MCGNARAAPALACLAFCLLSGSEGASAEGCPKQPVQENGGKHWCFSAGDTGRAHLWMPDAFNARTAVTVVYVHGYNADSNGRCVRGKGSGVDGCVNAHYLDCAWDRHALAAQFAASGLNALFIAVEAPTNDRERPKWTSLGGLLRSIRRQGGIEPPASVTAVAHSGGIFTVLRFLDDARLAHVVALDALYADSPGRLAKWYGTAKIRRLTLVGAQSRHSQTAALSGKLACLSFDDLTMPYSDAARSARCVTMVVEHVGHMDVMKDGHAIPLVLTRAVAPPAPKSEHDSNKRHR